MFVFFVCHVDAVHLFMCMLSLGYLIFDARICVMLFVLLMLSWQGGQVLARLGGIAHMCCLACVDRCQIIRWPARAC